MYLNVMIQYNNISAQKVSWLSSNKRLLNENSEAIKCLFYPENIKELEELVCDFYNNHKYFDIIGWSSNTLFLPSYNVDNLICTKKLTEWSETNDSIICDCGVSVSKLAKQCVDKGYKGFYGLVDLPGTIAAAVYGNCGCFNCSLLELLDYIILLVPQGKLVKLSSKELAPTYRSTALKRGEIKGIIIQVILSKNMGNIKEEQDKANEVSMIRRRTQPNGLNNLGSTFVLGSVLSEKGHKYYRIKAIFQKWFRINDNHILQKISLTLLGGYRFTPYLFDLGRWMFYDTKSYDLLFEYQRFIKELFPKAHLEIEVRK